MTHNLSIEDCLKKEKEFISLLFTPVYIQNALEKSGMKETFDAHKKTLSEISKLPTSRFNNPNFQQQLDMMDAMARFGSIPPDLSNVERDTELVELFDNLVENCFAETDRPIENTQPPNTRFCVKQKRKKN